MNLVSIVFIVLTTLDGNEVNINPNQIVRMTETSEAHDVPAPNRVVTPGARCVISLTDGKFVSVKEECDAIRKRVEELK